MGDSHTRPGAEVLCLSRSQAEISSQTPAERLGKCAQGGQLGWKWNLNVPLKKKKKSTAFDWLFLGAGITFFFFLFCLFVVSQVSIN